MSFRLDADFGPLISAFENLIPRFEAASRTAVGRAGFVIEAAVKRQLTTSSHKKGSPTPSSPGEPPSLVSGTLRRSIQTEIYGSGLTTGARIGPTVIYGRIQELGGTAGRGAELPARPYMQPALDEVRDQLRDVVISTYAGAISE